MRVVHPIVFVSRLRGIPPYLSPMWKGSDWLNLMHLPGPWNWCWTLAVKSSSLVVFTGKGSSVAILNDSLTVAYVKFKARLIWTFFNIWFLIEYIAAEKK